MSVKFWKKNNKKLMTDGSSMQFEDMMTMLHDWIGILAQKAAPMKRQAVRIAATEISSSEEAPPAKKARESDSPVVVGGFPAAVPSTRCHVCNNAHMTQGCPELVKQDIDGRMKILNDKRLCYHCLGPFHSARFCRNRPQCGCCGRSHNSLLHDRVLKPNAPPTAAPVGTLTRAKPTFSSVVQNQAPSEGPASAPQQI